MLIILTVIWLIGIFFLPFYKNGWYTSDYYDGMFASKFGSGDAAQAADGATIFGITMMMWKIVTFITGVLGIVCAYFKALPWLMPL